MSQVVFAEDVPHGLEVRRIDEDEHLIVIIPPYLYLVVEIICEGHQHAMHFCLSGGAATSNRDEEAERHPEIYYVISWEHDVGQSRGFTRFRILEASILYEEVLLTNTSLILEYSCLFYTGLGATLNCWIYYLRFRGAIWRLVTEIGSLHFPMLYRILYYSHPTD